MGLLQSIAALFYRFNRPPNKKFSRSRAPKIDPHTLGRLGERAAARHLQKVGYRVLYWNFRAPHGGEVDLVCRHETTLVFVEVKTRRTVRHGRPASAVHLHKQRLIARGAIAWLRMLNNPAVPFRFDIVEVVTTPSSDFSIQILENAFQLPEPWSD